MPGPHEPDWAAVYREYRRHNVGPNGQLIAERQKDGSLRLHDGRRVDPVLAHHLGYLVEPLHHSVHDEPDWTRGVDISRPVQGRLVELFTQHYGFCTFLQRFRYTKAGPIPDGLPQPINYGRTPDNRPIYACPHTIPPPIRSPFLPNCERLEPNNWEQTLERHGLHPRQYTHLDPALVAQEVDPPWVQQYPEFFASMDCTPN